MDYRLTANATVDDINKVIKNNGTNEYGDPLFRVVFSDDQVESRRGNFTDTHGSLFIRTVNEIREVRKYPWIKEKWILERWASGELSKSVDYVSMKNGVYVCVYVFQDKNQDYLPPLLKVTEIVIHALLHPKTKDEILADDKKWDEANEKKEVNKIEEEIIINSDELSTKDSKSSRESMSVGYAKDRINNQGDKL